MEKGDIVITAIAIAILVAICVFGAASFGMIADELGLSDKAQAALDARVSEAYALRANAEAERTAAQADLADAQARIEREKGEAQSKRIQANAEAELYSAAAASVRKDSKLVAWYAVRRDVLLVAALFPLEAGAGIAAGVYLARRKQEE